MILKNCDSKTKYDLMVLMDKVFKGIVRVESIRNNGKTNGHFPKPTQTMINKVVSAMFQIVATKGSDVSISDDVVEFICDYEMVDFYDELEEMQYYGKLKIVR